jgi:hypothetical protein
MADFKDLELIKSSKETEIVNCNILGVKVATSGSARQETENSKGSETGFKELSNNYNP